MKPLYWILGGLFLLLVVVIYLIYPVALGDPYRGSWSRRWVAWKQKYTILGSEGFWNGSTFKGAWRDLWDLPSGFNLL